MARRRHRRKTKKKVLDPKDLPQQIADLYVDSVEPQELRSPKMEHLDIAPWKDHWNPEQRMVFHIIFRALVDLLLDEAKAEEARSWLYEVDPDSTTSYPPWSLPWACEQLDIPIDVIFCAILLIEDQKEHILYLDLKKTEDEFVLMFGKLYGAVWREIDQAYKIYRGEYDGRQRKDDVSCAEPLGSLGSSPGPRTRAERIERLSSRARTYLSRATNDPSIRKRLRASTEEG